jgi:hypothetical protein
MSTLSVQIRDAAFTRITTVITSFASTRKTPFPTIQTDQVPALGVFLLREQYSPDGDADVGPPRYVTDATIAIAVVNLSSDPAVLDGSIDSDVDLILDTLLCDPTFLDLRDTVTGQPIIEAIPQITRTTRFPKEGETYYCEVSLQMTFRFRCFFEPLAPNELEIVSVQAEPFGSAGATFTTQFDVGS